MTPSTGQILSVQRLKDPEHPFHESYEAWLGLYIDSSEVVKRISGELAAPLRPNSIALDDVETERMKEERDTYGVLSDRSNILLPLLAVMCQDLSNGKILSKIEKDTMAALARQTHALDLSSMPPQYLPHPIQGSGDYSDIQETIISIVERAEDYRAL